jgi:hypothetical protein
MRRYNMGYRTQFCIDIIPEPSKELLEETISGGMTIGELYEEVTDEMKWYDHEEEMVALSLKYPDYVFILDGRGESPDDVWRSFYKNGKFYDWSLEYTLPEFDEYQLQ